MGWSQIANMAAPVRQAHEELFAGSKICWAPKYVPSYHTWVMMSIERNVEILKVLPWVVEGAGGLGAGKTSGAGTRGVDLNAAVGGRTGYTDTNGGESSNNGSKIHADCYPAENPSL